MGEGFVEFCRQRFINRQLREFAHVQRNRDQVFIRQLQFLLEHAHLRIALDLIKDVRCSLAIEQRRANPPLAVFTMTDPAGYGQHVQFLAALHEFIGGSRFHGIVGSCRGDDGPGDDCWK